MHDLSRRSAIALAAAATTALASGAGSALAQGSALNPQPGQTLPKGVSRNVLGKRDAMLPDYKNVQMSDLVYQPGAKTDNASMPSDMVCHVPQGELHIKKSDGEFTAKTGDVWTCKKGEREAVENKGKAVAIMRVIQLLA